MTTKVALVTGASSGIGLAITKKLLTLNYRVYGLSRQPEKANITDTQFFPISCDLKDSKRLIHHTKAIIKKEKQLDCLVNNAGVGLFGRHDLLEPEAIVELVQINLGVPMLLSQLVLQEIKRSEGWIINISSITAKKISTYGCAYAATKAGLTHFSQSLFEEVRKTGAKIVTIHPDMTDTPFFDALDFTIGEQEDTFLTPQCIANAVETILTQRIGTVFTDITLRPQKLQVTQKNK